MVISIFPPYACNWCCRSPRFVGDAWFLFPFQSGNDLFDQRQYARASSKYAKVCAAMARSPLSQFVCPLSNLPPCFFPQGVQVLEPARLEGEDDEKQWKAALLKLYLNLALCSLRRSQARRAITHCHKALDLDPLSVKGIFRLGQVSVDGVGVCVCVRERERERESASVSLEWVDASVAESSLLKVVGYPFSDFCVVGEPMEI